MEGLPEDEKRLHILNFLKDFKELMGQGQYWVKGHQKNLQALAELGLTERQREEYILSLSVEDYVAGPIRDELKPGDYWVFGRNIGNIEVYIKLKLIQTRNDDEKAVCLSFHAAERPLKYPLKKSK